MVNFTIMPSPSLTTEKFQALGQSEAFLNLQERISLAAKTERSVIFIGERGTGKELAAHRLHLLSKRWNEPYLTLNCASLSPTLIESDAPDDTPPVALPERVCWAVTETCGSLLAPAPSIDARAASASLRAARTEGRFRAAS